MPGSILVNETLESQASANPWPSATPTGVCRPGEAASSLKDLISRLSVKSQSENNDTKIVLQSTASTSSGPYFGGRPIAFPNRPVFRISHATTSCRPLCKWFS